MKELNSISLEEYGPRKMINHDDQELEEEEQDQSTDLIDPLLPNHHHHPSSLNHSIPSSGRFNILTNNPSSQLQRWRIFSILVFGIGLITFIIGLIALSTAHRIRSLNEEDSDRISSIQKFPERLAKSKSICDFCDCNLNRTSPPLLLLNSSYSDLNSNPNIGTRVPMLAHVWLSIRDIYCRHPWLAEGPALELLLKTELSQDIQSMMQWRLDLLEPGIPTAYIFTKTSWAGRTKHLRYAYFQRHIITIRTYLARSKQGVYKDQEIDTKFGPKRQLIWIIVEDGERLAHDVSQELINTDLPYIYFTYGPTHHFGNAQQNAAYGLIHRLSDPTMGGIFGHGPIISIDDDSNILPELLSMIWKVKRIGVWPMGHLGPTGWEGPVYDPVNKTLIDWVAGAIKDRKFPIDNGAFAFSSHLLGDIIKGPRYWPTDISGGENEFVSLIVNKKEELEPLCYNCRVAWHNEPLPPRCRYLQLCP